MSSDATLRELKAGLEDNTTMAVPQPWSFRPMGFLSRIGALLIAALLALVMFYGFSGVVVFVILALTRAPDLTWKDWLVTGMFCAACGGITYAALLGFRRVRRRAVYMRQVTQCGKLSCRAVSRSFFRSFRSEGNPVWSTSSLSLPGILGPHLGPRMLAVLLFNVLALAVAALGQPSFVIGGLGAVAIMGLGSRKEKIEIFRRQLNSVRCDGPVLTLHLAPPPRSGLNIINIVVAPSTAVEFLTRFNQVFPGALPSSYTDHLKNGSDTFQASATPSEADLFLQALGQLR